MTKKILCVAIAGLTICFGGQAFALKQFNDQFKKMYVTDDASEEFKELVKEARCNVCHVKRENKKKVRNPYGEALHELIEKTDFPVDDYKKNTEKYADEVKAIFEEVEKMKSGYEDHETFKARMEAGLLPGGNVDGKKDE